MYAAGVFMLYAFDQGIDVIHKQLGILQQPSGYRLIFLHGQNFGFEVGKISLYGIELL